MNSEHMVIIQNIVKKIVQAISNNNYEKITEITNNQRVSSKVIKSEIEEYGRTICVPNQDVFKNIDIVYVEDSNPNQYSVRFDLYTEEEGLSDLTLEMTFFITESNHVTTEIDGIHVL
ncbi:MAG: hypothetical protein JJU29_06720 [Verrucomicrobia bacterium]|nr:hypothetical protein [Verrucomicrobiota bacterium]MCH8511567.1 hypothetical protein [Kiritimatiellia bacterium]